MYWVDVMYWNIEPQKFSSQLSGGTTTHMLFNFEEFFYCWRKWYWFQKTYIFSHKLFMFSKFGISWSNSPERKCCWKISRKLFRYLKIMFLLFDLVYFLLISDNYNPTSCIEIIITKINSCHMKRNRLFPYLYEVHESDDVTSQTYDLMKFQEIWLHF